MEIIKVTTGTPVAVFNNNGTVFAGILEQNSSAANSSGDFILSFSNQAGTTSIEVEGDNDLTLPGSLLADIYDYGVGYADAQVYQQNSMSSPYELNYSQSAEGRENYGGTEATMDYYLRDHLGSTRGVLSQDNMSSAFETMLYMPYGSKINGNGSIQVAGDPTRETFGGKEQDNDIGTGLYYFGARYYDPVIGSWTSRDPVESDFNTYSYCSGNPVGNIDPTGLYSLPFHSPPGFDGNCPQHLCIPFPGVRFDKQEEETSDDGDNLHIKLITKDPVRVEYVVDDNNRILEITYQDNVPVFVVDKGSLMTPGTTIQEIPTPMIGPSPAINPEMNHSPIVSTAAMVSSPTPRNTYYNDALRYDRTGDRPTKYFYGGFNYFKQPGLDCSGLILQVVMDVDHIRLRDHGAWLCIGMPPGNWKQIYPNRSSQNAFLQSCNIGDLFVWTGNKKLSAHAAFFAGQRNGRYGLFHAQSGNKPIGYTWDLLAWWIPTHGLPGYVWRQSNQ